MANVDDLVIRATLRDELSRGLREVREEVRRTERQVDDLGDKSARSARQMDKAERSSGLLGKSVGGLATAAKLGAVALVGLGAGAAAGLTKVVGLASDASETASKFATVFGESTAAAIEWQRELTARTGITSKALQDAASTFGVFGQSAGVAAADLAPFSQNLVEAGLDLSSFYNVDPEEAFQALKSGLAGQAEPLQKFGIFLSEANLNAFALEKGLGKTTKEMTDAEKVQLRQTFILEKMGAAQGDLGRTQDGLANKTRSLKGRLEEAGTAIGTAFLPYVTDAANVLDVWAQEQLPRLEGALGRLPAAIEAVRGRFIATTDAWRTGATYGDTVSTLFGVDITDAVNAAADVIGDLVKIVTDLLWPAINEASSFLPRFTSPLKVARSVVGFLADNAERLVPLLSAAIAGFVAWKTATVAYNAVTAIANALTFIRTASTAGLAAAQVGATTATGGLAAGTAVLNAIMSLNPIVLVVAALAALVAGLVIAYRRSETFRALVDRLWQTVTRTARAVRDGLGRAFEWVTDKVSDAIEAVRRFVDRLRNLPGAGLIERVFGDTATPRGTAGGLGRTLATHGRIDAAVPGSRTITNATYGRPGGDHPAGRALDLKGSNLLSYARAVRQAGGFAEFHGSGGRRHLHAVYGDTATPRRPSPVAAGGGGGLTLAGPLVGTVYATSDVDVERALERGLERWMRDRAERGGR